MGTEAMNRGLGYQPVSTYSRQDSRVETSRVVAALFVSATIAALITVGCREWVLGMPDERKRGRRFSTP